MKHRKYARKLSIAATEKARKLDLRGKFDPAYRRAVARATLGHAHAARL